MIPQCYKRFQSLFYWITYSYNQKTQMELTINQLFQSLFYWITYSYKGSVVGVEQLYPLFQSLFYWITYSYYYFYYLIKKIGTSFNPYFIGLPILMTMRSSPSLFFFPFQSLFYWITYSYIGQDKKDLENFRDVSILILLDYLFLYL